MAETAQIGKRKRRGLFYTLVSALVTAAVFGVLLSYVSVGEIVDLLRNADAKGVALFMFLSFLMSFCRAWRYKILLRLSGYSPHIITVYLVVLLGNSCSDLLPARLGSLIYVFIFTTRLGVPFAAAMSSFAVAFLFDMLTVGPLAAVIVWGISSESDVPRAAIAVGGAVIALLTFAFLKYLPEFFAFAGKIVRSLPLVSTGLRDKIARQISGAEEEIRRTRSAGLYTQLFVLSIIIKIIKYGAQYMFLYALVAPLGYTFSDLSIFRVFAGICASEVMTSMPFTGLGGYGIYEGTWAFVLHLLGFPKEIAILTSIPHHLFVQVWGYALGFAALAIIMLPFFKADGARERKPYPPESNTWFFARASLAVLLLVLAFVYLSATDTVRAAS